MKRLDRLPPMETYLPDAMSPDDRKKFIKWYMENINTPFYLPEKLAEYCSNDTEILLESIVEMRKILIEITEGIDVLEHSATIAGISMNIFKSLFLQKNQLALVPEGGYEKNDRASVIAIKYFEWLSKTENIEIKHAANGGEMRVGKYKLDAFIPKENRAIEFLGY